MRIVHYHNRIRLADGGVVRAVLDICTLVAQSGHEVVLITCDDADTPESWGSPGTPRVERVPPKTGGEGGGFGLFSREALEQIEPIVRDADVVHLHTIWDRGNLQIARIAQRSGVPYVATAHGMLDDWCMSQSALKKRVYHWLFLRKFFANAAFVHCTAEFEKTLASKWFPPQKGRVIPLIFDLTEYEDLPGREPAMQAIPQLQTDEPCVLFLSRLHPKKSVEVLIEATALLREAGAPIQLFIAGTGEDDYERLLRDRTAAEKLSACVHFLGLVVGEEKVSLFQTCDLFALPTSQENFGFVLIESLAARTPVITTKGVDIWPELEKSGGALIVDRDARAFAEAIRTLLADDDRRRKMGDAGREWVMEYLRTDRIVKEFESMYEESRGAGK